MAASLALWEDHKNDIFSVLFEKKSIFNENLPPEDSARECIFRPSGGKNLENSPTRCHSWWCLCRFNLCTSLPKKTLDSSLGRREGVSLQVPLSSTQCVLLIHKNVPFIPGVTLSYSTKAFLFLKNANFFSLKNSLLFSRIALSFPKVSSFYLLCASFFKNTFFPADCNFSSCSEWLG